MLLLAGLLLGAASPRTHWRRVDGRPAEPAAVAAALAACPRARSSAPADEAATGACMARQGYFSWDGI